MSALSCDRLEHQRRNTEIQAVIEQGFAEAGSDKSDAGRQKPGKHNKYEWQYRETDVVHHAPWE